MLNQNGEYDSVLVGKMLVAIAYENQCALNITKLQKLLYIAYGYYLANENRRLCDEHPQAWPFGPVFPKTRKHVNLDRAIYQLKDEELIDIAQDEDLKRIIKQIVLAFKDVKANQLSAWSHQDGSPWDTTQRKNGFKWGDQIADNLIKEYFANRFVINNE